MARFNLGAPLIRVEASFLAQVTAVELAAQSAALLGRLTAARAAAARIDALADAMQVTHFPLGFRASIVFP